MMNRRIYKWINEVAVQWNIISPRGSIHQNTVTTGNAVAHLKIKTTEEHFLKKTPGSQSLEGWNV